MNMSKGEVAGKSPIPLEVEAGKSYFCQSQNIPHPPPSKRKQTSNHLKADRDSRQQDRNQTQNETKKWITYAENNDFKDNATVK